MLGDRAIGQINVSTSRDGPNAKCPECPCLWHESLQTKKCPRVVCPFKQKLQGNQR